MHAPVRPADQYSPNRSWIRTSSAAAILYSDDSEADDSALSICDKSETLSPVLRDIYLNVSSLSLHSPRILSPITL